MPEYEYTLDELWYTFIDELWYTFIHYAGSCLMAKDPGNPIFQRHVDSYPLYMRDAYDTLRDVYHVRNAD